MVERERIINSQSGTLSGTHDGVITTVTLASYAGWPTSGQLRIKIEDEILLVTDLSVQPWPVQRGLENTLPVSHLDGTTVTAWLTAGSLAGVIGAYDAGTLIGNVSEIDVTGSGATPSVAGNRLTIDVPAPGTLTVKESDGTPTVTPVTTLAVTNGKLTDNGSGQVTLDLSGNGGTPAAHAATHASGGTDALTGVIPGLAFAPTGFTGATTATRYVGGTASGAPASGTFSVGDFVIARDGAVWVCTAGGSPGTWVQPGASHALNGPQHTIPYATKTANYTVLTTDFVLDVDTTAGDVTLTLPSAATAGQLKRYVVRMTAGANRIVLAATVGQTVGLTNTTTLPSLPWVTAVVASNGANGWFVESLFAPTHAQPHAINGVATGVNAGLTGHTIPTNTVTADYTVTDGDYRVVANSASGAITITLPSPAAVGVGTRYVIARSGANNVQIGAGAGNAFADGAVAINLTVDGGLLEVESAGGTTWDIVSFWNGPLYVPVHAASSNAVHSLGESPVSTNTTITNHGTGLVQIDATAGNVTVTLPTIGSAWFGEEFYFTRTDNSANTATVAASGTDTIRGAASMAVAYREIVCLRAILDPESSAAMWVVWFRVRGDGTLLADPAWDAKGSILAATGAGAAAALTVGVDGKILTANSAAPEGVSWEDAPPTGNVATDPIFDALGDLAVGTGANTAARLARGVDGQILATASTEPTGLQWIDAPTGGAGAGFNDAEGDPAAVASTGADGTSANAARRDHAHPHGSGYLPNAHHAQSHAHDGADGAGTVDHANLTNVTADQHHAQSHDIDGADHTASGLTTGHVMQALSTTTFGFALNPLEDRAVAAGDILVATGPDTFVRLPVGGTDGDVLTVASAQPEGVAWMAPGSGTTKTERIALAITTPRESTLGGNAGWDVVALTAIDLGHWRFLKDVEGRVVGHVAIPHAIAATPNAKLVLSLMANTTTNVTRMLVKTKAVAVGESMNPATMTAETAIDLTVPATAFQRFEVTFPASGSLAEAVAADDLLLVEIVHDGGHVNDTLSVDTLLVQAWLQIDVPA